MMPSDAEATFEYDVALSFAGEDRGYVSAVAEVLRAKGIRIFYDLYEESRLWGKDLYQHLDYVYGKAARFCVVFVSSHYANKLWTSHELKSAQARAFEEGGEYILPARLDETEIPGLRSTQGYVDLRSKTPEQCARLVVEKIVPYKLMEFHKRRDYFPPTTDVLWKSIKAKSKKSKSVAYDTAYGFYRALRRLDDDERLLLLTVFFQGCRHDYPQNAHIEVDLLRRIVGIPKSKIKSALSNVSSVGFEVRFCGPDGVEMDDFKYVYVSWTHISTSLRDQVEDPDLYSTWIVFEIIDLVARHYCEDHGPLVLLDLNFSSLSMATAVEHVHG